MKNYILIILLCIFACDESPTEHTDCHGNINGSAVEDACGNCGGDCIADENGFISCSDGEDANLVIPDCAGVCGGESVMNECGSTGCGYQIPDGHCDCYGNVADCANVCEGSAVEDACGNCVGGNTGAEACVEDCNGDFGGAAELDECGVCDGSGIPIGNCDCNGNILDCAGECGGNGPDIDNDGICDWNDGDSYATIIIGEQEWMQENLKVTHFSNGDEIPNVGFANIPDLSSYTTNPDFVDIYGNYYNWWAVNDDRGLCPEGWHVPSDEEMIQLEVYLGMSEDVIYSEGPRGTNKASKLAGRADLWYDHPNENNLIDSPDFGSSGFDFIPGNSDYEITGESGSLWTSSSYSDNRAYNRAILSANQYIYRYSTQYKYWAKAVRCIAD